MEWLVLLVAPPPWHPKLDLMAEMVCPSEQSLAVKTGKDSKMDPRSRFGIQFLESSSVSFTFASPRVRWIIHQKEVYSSGPLRDMTNAFQASDFLHNLDRQRCVFKSVQEREPNCPKSIQNRNSLSLICCCLAKDAHCVQTFKASAASVYSKTPAMHSCTPLVRHVSNSDAQRFFSKNHLRFCRKMQQIPNEQQKQNQKMETTMNRHKAW